MKIKRKKTFATEIISLLVALIFFLIAQNKITPSITNDLNQSITPTPRTLGISTISTASAGLVTRVVDGDTLEVEVEFEKKKVRVLGINTPESVDPRKSVECLGREASNKAKEIILNQKVLLEADSSQTDQDRYGRLLRYVTIEKTREDFGSLMISLGLANEYTYKYPYEKQELYKTLEAKAREQKVGLWNLALCNK